MGYEGCLLGWDEGRVVQGLLRSCPAIMASHGLCVAPPVHVAAWSLVNPPYHSAGSFNTVVAVDAPYMQQQHRNHAFDAHLSPCCCQQLAANSSNCTVHPYSTLCVSAVYVLLQQPFCSAFEAEQAGKSSGRCRRVCEARPLMGQGLDAERHGPGEPGAVTAGRDTPGAAGWRAKQQQQRS